MCCCSHTLMLVTFLQAIVRQVTCAFQQPQQHVAQLAWFVYSVQLVYTLATQCRACMQFMRDALLHIQCSRSTHDIDYASWLTTAGKGVDPSQCRVIS